MSTTPTTRLKEWAEWHEWLGQVQIYFNGEEWTMELNYTN